jgi:hypothetical protein
MIKRREENQAAIRKLLDDPALPPLLRRILTTDPHQLTEAELKVHITLVFQQRRKRRERASSEPVLPPPTYILPKRERLAFQAAERRRQRHLPPEGNTPTGAR